MNQVAKIQTFFAFPLDFLQIFVKYKENFA